MTGSKSFSLKKGAIIFLMISWGLIGAYSLFIGLWSVWIGITHGSQDGFWVPILAGGLLSLAMIWLSWYLFGIAWKHRRQTQTIVLSASIQGSSP